MREGISREKERTLSSEYVGYINPNTIIDRHTCLYSDRGIRYQQEHSGPFDDLSHRGADAVIFAALKNGQITGFGRPVLAAGSARTLKQEIQRLYDTSSRNIWYQDFLENGNLSEISKFLLRRGARAEPYYTQIIDLTKSEHYLHGGVRKSYTSLINARLGNVKVINSKSPELDEIFSAFKKLYYEKVDRPRPLATWDIQLEMIRADEAFIVADLEQDKLVSAGLFLHNRYICYYGSGKSLPDCISHGTIWKAILHAKEINLKSFEVGQIIFYGESKLVGISTFKSGFGGKTKMYLQIRSS